MYERCYILQPNWNLILHSCGTLICGGLHCLFSCWLFFSCISNAWSFRKSFPIWILFVLRVPHSCKAGCVTPFIVELSVKLICVSFTQVQIIIKIHYRLGVNDQWAWYMLHDIWQWPMSMVYVAWYGSWLGVTLTTESTFFDLIWSKMRFSCWEM